MKWKILTILIFQFLVFTGYGNSFKQKIYQAYVQRDMNLWIQTVDAMTEVDSNNALYLLELLNYQYGLIGWSIDLKMEDQAEKYLHMAEKNLERLEKAKFRLSMLESYKAAFYGFKINMNILSGPVLGPKSIASAEKSIKLDPTNPFGYLQYANIQYYMPVIFGGSKTEALTFYLKAEKLMQNNPSGILQDWNYLNLLNMIVRAYNSLNQQDKANSYIQKILKIEPGYKIGKMN